MVVWQGITEGGTAVPVQITEDGKVVAVGEQGPEGPPGPPGQAEWPPNPIEGAFLIWLNGEPAWYTEQPIPTPPGTAGPITGVSDNSLFTFQNNLDQNVFFTGVQVYAVYENGGYWDGDGQYDTSKVWSVYATPSSPSGGQRPPSNVPVLFDGDLSSFYSLTSSNSQTARLTFNPPITASSSIRVYVDQSGTAINKTANGKTNLNADGWNNIEDTSLRYLEAMSGAGSGYFALNGIEVDGKLLLDTFAGPFPTGQISTVANNSALLSRVQGVWTEGLYMRADESAQAAWLFSKNRSGAPRKS